MAGRHRAVAALVVVAATTGSPLAYAEDTTTLTAAAAPHPRFAVMTDVGLPDAAVASVVFRPTRALQLHGGVGYNAISTGLRAGVTLVPLASWVSPTLSVDVGRYAEGDANPLARRISGDADFHSASLERVGYDYANAHVGLQLGQRNVSFFVRAGVSRITGSLRNLDSITDPMASQSVTFSEDPTVEMWSVSARLGLVVYLLK